MKHRNHHIIQTNEVEITFLQRQDDFSLQNKIADLVKQKLLPELEILFDTKAGDNRHIKIDSLEIELEIAHTQNWQEDFVEQSVTKIRQKLDAISYFIADDEVYEISYRSGQPLVQQKAPVYDKAEALIYFLQYGLLPWNFNDYTLAGLLESVMEKVNKKMLLHDDMLMQRLLEIILGSATTFSRFIIQFPDPLVKEFLQTFYDGSFKTLAGYAFERLPGLRLWSKTDQKLLQYLFALTVQETGIKKELITKISNELFSSEQLDKLKMVVLFISKNKQRDLLQFIELIEPPGREKRLALDKKSGKRSKNDTASPREQIYFIENAGLVLLHPFLPRLFANLQYTAGDTFINDELQRRAVLLTQYLINDENEMPEHELLLNKIICGYPIFDIAEYKLDITDQERNETSDLLLSVIEYWTALKNTSIEGLRNSFLQRPGKLTELDDGWLLQVEQKSYDVLMNYLPWGIGIIKLPWMKNLLRVEWVN